jgi:hypothetical protein
MANSKEPTTKEAEEARLANTQVTPVATPTEVKEAEIEESAEKTEAAKEGAQAVETKLGTSQEEKAAERAGVQKEALDNSHQNREPKNEFEKENQKVTEKERKAAQKESDLSTKQRAKNADTPTELAEKDAAKTVETNQGLEMAQAIVQGLKGANDKNFALQPDAGVEHRFSVVRNKQGEVMVRENETGVLSKVQLESIEEKEASIQGQDVEEI